MDADVITGRFRPLGETLADPFKPASMVQIALTTGLIVAVVILWVQVLHPVGERVAKLTEEIVE